jgi:hypothetical protein
MTCISLLFTRNQSNDCTYFNFRSRLQPENKKRKSNHLLSSSGNEVDKNSESTTEGTSICTFMDIK